jgi:hypothetical protein
MMFPSDILTSADWYRASVPRKNSNMITLFDWNGTATSAR